MTQPAALNFNPLRRIAKTRTGDQLHICFGSRTSCGCKVSAYLMGRPSAPREVKAMPGLMCERCFGPALLDDGRGLSRWNPLIENAVIVD